jgi:hypothetical protein
MWFISLFLLQEDYILHIIQKYVAVTWLRRLVIGFSWRLTGFDLSSGHVGFMVDKVAVEQGFYEYFSFPCQFEFHQPLHTH